VTSLEPERAAFGTPARARADRTGSLIEVFVSFQGEGPQVGQPTLFLRLAACPLRCRYCDTDYGFKAEPEFVVRGLGGGRIAEFVNPVEPSVIFAALPKTELARVRWVSATGGEPLLHAGFVTAAFRAARAHGLRTLLETAALDVAAMRQVLPETDHAAIDWKLRSTLPGGEDVSGRHAACIGAALDAGVDTSIKIVLTTDVGGEEFDEALTRLRTFREAATLILQPVTPCREVVLPLSASRLTDFASRALDAGFAARILPQMHKHLGLR